MEENHVKKDRLKIYAAVVGGNKHLNAADFCELRSSDSRQPSVRCSQSDELAQKSPFHMFPRDEMRETPLWGNRQSPWLRKSQQTHFGPHRKGIETTDCVHVEMEVSRGIGIISTPGPSQPSASPPFQRASISKIAVTGTCRKHETFSLTFPWRTFRLRSLHS